MRQHEAALGEVENPKQKKKQSRKIAVDDVFDGANALFRLRTNFSKKTRFLQYASGSLDPRRHQRSSVPNGYPLERLVPL